MSDTGDRRGASSRAGLTALAEALTQKASEVVDAASTAKDEIGHLGSEREARDRSWIARQIIWIFTGVILFALVVFLVQGWRSNDWGPVATEVTEIIRSAVLPVVTLILGYYFGRSGRI